MRSDETGADGRLQSPAHAAPWDDQVFDPRHGSSQRSSAMDAGAATPWLRDQPPAPRSDASETDAQPLGSRSGAVIDLGWAEANAALDPPEALRPRALSFSPEEEQELAKGLLLVVLR